LSQRAFRLPVLLGLLGLILLFFNKMAFSNLILARGDTYLYFYPYWQAAADALQSGRLPLWNPEIFMGAPFLANSQIGFFYPLNWPVWWLLSTPYAVSASILIHLFIAAWGAYLTGQRTLHLGPLAGLLAASLFALGGYLTAQVEHVNQLQGLAWLPWYFVVMAPIMGESNQRAGIRSLLKIPLWIAILVTLQLLAGHTQTVFISGVSIAVWSLVSVVGKETPVRGGIRLAIVLAAGFGLAVALAAVQLLPTWELTQQSSRQGGLALNEILSFSWHPLHLARGLLPAYEQPLFTEYLAFLPITGLMLVVIGAWNWHENRRIRPWIFLLLVALVLAFGRFTPVYHLLANLPGFDLFRVPARWLAPAALSAALIAGAGWQRLLAFADRDEMESGGRYVAMARQDLLRPVVAGFTGVALLVLWGFMAGWLAEMIPTGAEAPFEQPSVLNLAGWLVELAVLALLLWLILTQPPPRTRHGAYGLIGLAFITLWLGSRSLPYNQLTTPEAYFDLRPPPARLQASPVCLVPGMPCVDPMARFLSLSDIFFDLGDQTEIDAIYADQLSDAARYDYTIAVKHKEVISPNLSMIFGLPAVDGFDGGILPLRNYTELMRLLLPDGTTTTDGRLREFLDAVPDERWLSLFNSRYLITDKVGDEWRKGVFFDRQQLVQLDREPVIIGVVPEFEATEIWLMSDGVPPPVEIVTDEGQMWRLEPELLEEPDLYRAAFSEPTSPQKITLLPCQIETVECRLAALTLVDTRDETFLSLVPGPFRLIYSGDVKIYENLDVLSRAFFIYDWQWRADVAESVAVMGQDDFEPRRSAVLIGDGPAPPGEGTGTATIIQYAPEQVTLQVETDRDGLLLLTDAYYPGWEAKVDGRPAPVYQADGLFRGVLVPVGAHEVEFSYRPKSVRAGITVSLIGGALLLGLVFLLWRNRLADNRSEEK
jgi:hypothetical protein